MGPNSATRVTSECGGTFCYYSICRAHPYEQGKTSFLNALSRTAHHVALQRFLGTHHVMHENFVPV
jgi:hypothetical protein